MVKILCHIIILDHIGLFKESIVMTEKYCVVVREKDEDSPNGFYEIPYLIDNLESALRCSKKWENAKVYKLIEVEKCCH